MASERKSQILFQLAQSHLTATRIGSFYAFILQRCERVRLTVVARSNYEAVKSNVRPSSR